MPIQTKQQPPYYETTRNIKTYTAILNQTGTAAPIATELTNTIGTIIWTRFDVGSYRATLTGAFPQDKTICTIGTTGAFILCDSQTNFIRVETQNITPANEDGWLNNTMIQISVYQ